MKKDKEGLGEKILSKIAVVRQAAKHFKDIVIIVFFVHHITSNSLSLKELSELMTLVL